MATKKTKTKASQQPEFQTINLKRLDMPFTFPAQKWKYGRVKKVLGKLKMVAKTIKRKGQKPFQQKVTTRTAPRFYDKNRKKYLTKKEAESFQLISKTIALLKTKRNIEKLEAFGRGKAFATIAKKIGKKDAYIAIAGFEAKKALKKQLGTYTDEDDDFETPDYLQYLNPLGDVIGNAYTLK